MGVLKEFFTPIITEQYMQVPTFLDDVENDMSEFVEYNKIHLADAGIEPDTTINASGDIPIVGPRTDSPIEIVLDTADSDNTILTDLEAIQTNYKKAESLTRGHARSIMRKISANVSWYYTPTSDTTETPVLPTTSSTAQGGFKIITEDDIYLLKERYDAIDAPLNRVLVLHDTHLNQLLRTSSILREQQKFMGMLGKVGTQFYEFAGFKIRQFRGGAVFNKTTGAKKAFGAAAAPSTDTIASFSFVGSEVMKAFGDTELYIREKDPEKRASYWGFRRRFVGRALRNKYIGAIYSAASA